MGTLEYISFECNRETDFFRKASVVLHEIITLHPFFDGNKRTALAVAYLILRKHGYKLQSDRDSIIGFLLQVASYRVDVKGIEE